MEILNSIKHAPHWAWYTVAGVGAGAFALHTWRSRTTADGTTPAAGSTDLTTMGGDPAYGMGGSPAGVIVPPVILPPSDSGGGVDPVGMFDAVVGGVQGLMGSVGQVYQDVWGPTQEANLSVFQSNAAALSSIAQAGSAPQPVASNPTPVVTDVPIPAPTPAATPNTPTVVPKPSDPCTGEFPFQGPHGCYKVTCATGKGDHAKGRWHFYKSGAEVHVNSTC